MPNRKWSDLSPGWKSRYRREDVRPATYNKWQRMSPHERTKLNKAARASGYEDGLMFLMVQSRIKYHGAKHTTIKVSTKSDRAALMLLSGTHGEENQENRRLVRSWMGWEELSPDEWSAALGSP